jgi:hypothetical protein
MSEITIENLASTVQRVVDTTPVLDIHTHLYPPSFGDLLLRGIDELLTYHYLIAEVFRVAPQPYEQFWRMPKPAQADYIWKHLFIERSPVSEACRGVLTVLHAFGLDADIRNLDAVRRHLAAIPLEEHVDRVFTLANVRSVIMTNDPFDESERPLWLNGGGVSDPRFQPVLRLDPLLNDWIPSTVRLRKWGKEIRGDLGAADAEVVRTYLTEWIERMKPRYLAVSLHAEFRFPDDGPRGQLIERCVLPVARRAGLPFAMMIGVQRELNPGLQSGGDGVGRADVGVVSRLCARFPENRFLVTMLSRENQHELCVTARKHPNLLVFGCWWFLNNPSIIEEMTRERFELLGLSFVPQHSDARVLDQIIYKWGHSRSIIAKVLSDKYADLMASGWKPTELEIQRDVADLFGNVFERFCSGTRQEKGAS